VPVLYYWIYPDFQNKGIATEAVRIFLHTHPLQFSAHVKPSNMYSKRILRKNGFFYLKNTNDHEIYAQAQNKQNNLNPVMRGFKPCL
jgi:RimJ/RimL family protein N-acetyltransferase